MSDFWRFTVFDLVKYQHEALDAAAEICEIMKDAGHSELSGMIMTLERNDLPKQETMKDGEPPELNMKADPSTWRFCVEDVHDYHKRAIVAAAQVCNLEDKATNAELATMIRTLKRENSLI